VVSESDDLSTALKRARLTGDFRFRARFQDRQKPFKLPGELRKMPNLRLLSCGNVKLEDLPDWLADFPELTKLDLADTELSSFPPVITRMTSLRELGLSSNSLRELPDDIGNLTNLVALSLPGTGIAKLPASIAALTALEALDLGANDLRDINAIASLSRLRVLHLWGNRFTRFPAVLRGLRALEVLNLSRSGTNELEDDDRFNLGSDEWGWDTSRLIGTDRPQMTIASIPEWAPDAFPNLRVLSIGGVNLKALPGQVAKLTKLEAVFAANNHLAAIPAELSGLVDLRMLDLRNNAIKTLPPGFSRLRKLEYLGLQGNPLPILPEILENSRAPKALLDFVERIQQEDAARPLAEAKLLVVGEGSVGKTSLIKRLVSSAFDPHETKTEGIDITRWRIQAGGDDIALNIWDFGGQEIMHATHQFFLTKRSLYLLVIDARQGEEQNRIEYWLKLIQSLSDRSPVVVIGNKIDQGALDVDRRGLKAKYPNIVDFVSVSSKTGAGMDEAVKVLTTVVDQLEHVRDPVRNEFFAVKERLEQLKVDYLSYSEYQDICRESGLADPDVAASLLHDLGTVLWFGDDPRLSNTKYPESSLGNGRRLSDSQLKLRCAEEGIAHLGGHRAEPRVGRCLSR
jgi:internalin A